MKSIRFCSCCMILLVLSLTPLAGDTEVSGNACVFSRYMWRGLRLSDSGVFQAEGTIARRGFGITVWGNYDFDQTRINEVDLTINAVRTFGKFTVEAGFIHYGLVDAKDSDELYTSLSYDGWPVSPSVAIYIDVNAGKGAYLEAGLSRSVTLAPFVSFKLGGTAGFVIENSYMGTNERNEEFTNLFAADLFAALPFQIKPHISLEPKAGFSFPLSGDAKHAIKHFGFGSSATNFYAGITLNWELP